MAMAVVQVVFDEFLLALAKCALAKYTAEHQPPVAGIFSPLSTAHSHTTLVCFFQVGDEKSGGTGAAPPSASPSASEQSTQLSALDTASLSPANSLTISPSSNVGTPSTSPPNVSVSVAAPLAVASPINVNPYMEPPVSALRNSNSSRSQPKSPLINTQR